MEGGEGVRERRSRGTVWAFQRRVVARAWGDCGERRWAFRSEVVRADRREDGDGKGVDTMNVVDSNAGQAGDNNSLSILAFVEA